MRTIWIRSPVTYASVVHSTWPSWAMWRTHAPTFNKWQKTKKKKKTLHMLTHDTMRGCGLTSWVICINDKFCDIREKNVRIRSEIWTTNTRSPGFQDIRECITLWGLILRSLGCSVVWRGVVVMYNKYFQPLNESNGLHGKQVRCHVWQPGLPWLVTKIWWS